MRILEIELKDWGPHKHIVEKIDSNVLGVLGSNGRGKSNFLQAIDYALTGNLDKQNKTDYIRNYGSEGGAKSASVRLVFSKNGEVGTISRTITSTTTKRELVWDGEKYTKDADVASMMFGILGADKAAMANAIFIKQGAIANLVKGTPGERYEIFQKLMNLNFLDARNIDIQNKINALQAGIVDYQPMLDTYRERQATVKSTMAALAETLEGTPSRQTDIARLDSLSRLLLMKETTWTTFTKANALRNEAISALTGCEDIKKLEQTVSSISAKLKTARTQQGEYAVAVSMASTVAKLQEDIATAEEQVKATTVLLEVYQSQKVNEVTTDDINTINTDLNYKRQLVTLKEDLKQLDESLTGLQESLRVATASMTSGIPRITAKIAEYTEKLIASRNELVIVRLKSNLAKAETGNGDTCPVCNAARTPLTEKEITQFSYDITNLSAAVKQYEADIESENEKLRKLSSATLEHSKSLEHTEVLIKNTTGWVKYANEHITEVRKSWTVEQVEEDLAVMTKRRNDYLAYIANLESQEKVVAERIAYKEALEKQLEALPSKNTTAPSEALEAATIAVESLERELAEAEGKLVATTRKQDLFDERQRNWRALGKQYDDCTKSISEFDYGDSILESIENPDDLLNKVIVDKMKDELEAAEKERNNTQATLTATEGELLAVESQIKDVEVKMAMDEKKRALIDDLKRVRSLTSKSGVPQVYMNSVFRKITGLVQQLLTQMDANFTVAPDPENPMTFKFTRTDEYYGYEGSQHRLSGGQAVRLALALIIACQRVILPEVGLLVLDEPSSHIDAEGVESLKELFIKMTSVFQSAETQLIIVDHNSALNTAFEQVITL